MFGFKTRRAPGRKKGIGSLLGGIFSLFSRRQTTRGRRSRTSASRRGGGLMRGLQKKLHSKG